MSKIYGNPVTAPGGSGNGSGGKSAYEIAVAEGFEGTLTQWLESLVGPQGETGPRGETGPQGPQGEQGIVGPTAPVNLLDNSDFTNPVNQRGQTVYSGYGYTIDRWRQDIGTASSVVEIMDGYIRFTAGDNHCWMSQIPEKKYTNGQTYTVSILLQDNTLLVDTCTVTTGEITTAVLGNIHVRLSDDILNMVIIAGNSYDIKHVALYEGEYTAETLPAYCSKGYGAELAECQRYYCKFDKSIDPCWLIATDNSFATGAVNFPVQMRCIPTVTTLRCLDLSSQEVTVSGSTASEKGISWIEGEFTVGKGYRYFFEASADL